MCDIAQKLNCSNEVEISENIGPRFILAATFWNIQMQHTHTSMLPYLLRDALKEVHDEEMRVHDLVSTETHNVAVV